MCARETSRRLATNTKMNFLQEFKVVETDKFWQLSRK